MIPYARLGKLFQFVVDAVKLGTVSVVATALSHLRILPDLSMRCRNPSVNSCIFYQNHLGIVPDPVII